MADSKNAAQDSAQFKPFVWNCAEGLDPEARARASFLNDARDVVDGAHTLMQLLEWDEDLRDEAKPANGDIEPLLARANRASLQRLLIASLGMLQADIERQCEALDSSCC